MSIEGKTMFRLLGFLVGSASSIIIILLVVGMPNFNLSNKQFSQQQYDEAIENLKAKQRAFESVADRLSEDVARVTEVVEDKSEPLTNVLPMDTANATALAEEPLVTTQTPDQPPASEIHTTQNNDILWYSFWSPFRSELAATGFVSQLEKVTGIDYRVVKVQNGVYEVAFAYNDDTERHAKLSEISAATGLDLQGS
jgi:type II secretory pathway pseudopilin PulG